MSTITAELATLLASVDRGGDFYVAGTIELMAPLLRVDGVGTIPLPLLPTLAERLVAVADAAPYGRGTETLVDPAVRRTWQIGPDRVHLSGRHWQRTLAAIVARVAEGLGVNEPIDAEFYKLLVYDRGSFFVGHRDTEKAPGMFATLVIVLPSESSGGELLVRHAGREVRLDLRCEDPSEAAFAAFYADCVHEVLPISEGCRLTLVYNLLRRDRGPGLQPPSYGREQARVAALLRKWRAGKATHSRGDAQDDGIPEKLIYPLEHAYTPAELGFASLKGADAAAAGVLAEAAAQADCTLHLALVTVEESGAAEYADTGGRWSGSDEDEWEAGEVSDRYVRLSEWRTLDGSPSALGALPVVAGELSPPDVFDDIEPDEEYFQEATGNEGASFERTYSRAALVLWPRERSFAVLCQAGLSVTVPYLEAMAQRWADGSDEMKARLRDEAHDLAGHMIEQWPLPGWYSAQDSKLSDAARVLAILARMEDGSRITELVTRVIAAGIYGKGDNEALAAALSVLPQERQTALLDLIIDKTAAASFAACAGLLALVAGRVTDVRGACTRLTQAMPGDPTRCVSDSPWLRRLPAMEPACMVDLLHALLAVDQSLAVRAVAHVLAWPNTYDLDRVIVPVMRALVVASDGGAAIESLRDACLTHLRARIAEPLAPPTDWRRASAVPCPCKYCKELIAYLDDPAAKVWVLRAAEQHRSHVEGNIRSSHADINTTTDRRGRPYSLVCTKNQASYERRAAQRRQDLDDVARLAGSDRLAGLKGPLRSERT